MVKKKKKSPGTGGFSAELMALTCPSKWRCSASAVLWLSLPAMDILLWLACCWHNGGRFISKCLLQLKKKKLTHRRDCFNVVAQNTQACCTSSATKCIAEFCEYCQVAQEVLAAPQTTGDFLQIEFPSAALASLVSTDGYQFAFLLLIVTVSGAKLGEDLRKILSSKWEHCNDLLGCLLCFLGFLGVSIHVGRSLRSLPTDAWVIASFGLNCCSLDLLLQHAGAPLCL